MEKKAPRVLLAEDVDTNAEIVQALLLPRGIRADRAVNGRAALNLFSRRKAGYYAAILTDVQMPEMDGLALARAVRELKRPDAQAIPIIALSSDALPEDSAGISAFLQKPVDAERLIETLERLIP